MNILIWTMCFMAIPAICSAHSGNLINALSNYLPFIMPMILGAIATGKSYIKNFLSNISNKFRNND